MSVASDKIQTLLGMFLSPLYGFTKQNLETLNLLPKLMKLCSAKHPLTKELLIHYVSMVKKSDGGF